MKKIIFVISVLFSITAFAKSAPSEKQTPQEIYIEQFALLEQESFGFPISNIVVKHTV